jgi:hypothetical protein
LLGVRSGFFCAVVPVRWVVDVEFRNDFVAVLSTIRRSRMSPIVMNADSRASFLFWRVCMPTASGCTSAGSGSVLVPLDGLDQIDDFQ